jgi:hypothetical protein
MSAPLRTYGSPLAAVVLCVATFTQGPLQARDTPADPMLATETFFRFVSPIGEHIGQGTTRDDRRETAAFTATVDRVTPSITVGVHAADATRWTLRLAPPTGQTWVIGQMVQARRFSNEAFGQLDMSGASRTCNSLVGEFEVRDLLIADDGSVQRLRAAFTQYCSGVGPALTGEVSLVAPFDPTPPLPPLPPAAPPVVQPGSYFSYVSDTGDYIGGGGSGLLVPPLHRIVGTATTDRSNVQVLISPPTGSAWRIELAAPVGQALQAGVYSSATRFPFQSPIVPGLNVQFGPGRSCSSLTGTFTVYDIEFAPDATVTRLRATFEQHCQGLSPALRGDIVITPSAPEPAVSDPTDQALASGRQAVFAVGVTGNPAPALAWQESVDGGTTWNFLPNTAPYSGSTSAALRIQSSVGLTGRRYRVVASNASGTVVSASAGLLVYGDAVPAPQVLQFSAIKVGPAGPVRFSSPAQSVSLRFQGAPSTWSLSGPAWLNLTQTGPHTFSVAVQNIANAIGGQATLNGSITVSTPSAPTSLFSVPVSLRVDLDGEGAPPFGQVDTPAQHAAGLQGAIGVTGWALDDMGVTTVRIFRNCLAWEAQTNCQSVLGESVVFIGEAAFLAGARPDVQAAFSSYQNSGRAGWGLLVLTSMLPDVPRQLPFGGVGPLTFYAIAEDVEGRRVFLGRASESQHADATTPTFVSLANDGIAKPFGTIDTPALGATISGVVANFGWALTPDSNTIGPEPGDLRIPSDGSTVTVFVDGLPVAQVTYDQCRGTVGNPVPDGVYCDDDIASIFGNGTPQPPLTPRSSNPTAFRNLDVGRGAIGSHVLDTRTLTDGLHTLAWSVTDSAGRVEGLGSRFFTVLNGTADACSAGACARARAATRTQAEELMRRLPPPGAPAQSSPVTVWGRSGFALTEPWAPMHPTTGGVYRVRLPESGRLELWFGSEVADVFSVTHNDALDNAPVGSHLAGPRFTWMPPVGYLGTYRLVFLREGERVDVDVTVSPPKPLQPGQPEVRMHVDAVTSRCLSASSEFCQIAVEGWAFDPHAALASGIGTIHVWATRLDTDTTGNTPAPFFLGATDTLHLRPDVAVAFDAAPGAAGFRLDVPLPRGTYAVTAYVWNLRTRRWEDARTVIVRQ